MYDCGILTLHMYSFTKIRGHTGRAKAAYTERGFHHWESCCQVSVCCVRELGHETINVRDERHFHYFHAGMTFTLPHCRYIFGERVNGTVMVNATLEASGKGKPFLFYDRTARMDKVQKLGVQKLILN